MPDREMKCCDCGASFTFTEGEQRWYETKGFRDPKRCKPCRDAKKAIAMSEAYGGDGKTYRDRARGNR